MATCLGLQLVSRLLLMCVISLVTAKTSAQSKDWQPEDESRLIRANISARQMHQPLFQSGSGQNGSQLFDSENSGGDIMPNFGIERTAADAALERKYGQPRYNGGEGEREFDRNPDSETRLMPLHTFPGQRKLEKWYEHGTGQNGNSLISSLRLGQKEKVRHSDPESRDRKKRPKPGDHGIQTGFGYGLGTRRRRGAYLSHNWGITPEEKNPSIRLIFEIYSRRLTFPGHTLERFYSCLCDSVTVECQQWLLHTDIQAKNLEASHLDQISSEPRDDEDLGNSFQCELNNYKMICRRGPLPAERGFQLTHVNLHCPSCDPTLKCVIIDWVIGLSDLQARDFGGHPQIEEGDNCAETKNGTSKIDCVACAKTKYGTSKTELGACAETEYGTNKSAPPALSLISCDNTPITVAAGLGWSLFVVTVGLFATYIVYSRRKSQRKAKKSPTISKPTPGWSEPKPGPCDNRVSLTHDYVDRRGCRSVFSRPSDVETRSDLDVYTIYENLSDYYDVKKNNSSVVCAYGSQCSADSLAETKLDEYLVPDIQNNMPKQKRDDGEILDGHESRYDE